MATCTLFEIDNHKAVANVAKLYNRNEESLNEDVAKLREWMKSQPHLPEVMDDRMIRNFFIRSKCSVEKTKYRLDKYYTIKSELPDLFEDMNPEGDKIKRFMQNAFWVILPKPVSEIYRVFILKVRNKEFEKTDPVDAFKYVFRLAEVRLVEDTTIGEYTIFDLEGLTFAYLSKLTPVFLAKCFTVYERVISMQLKGIYFINNPRYATILVNILKKLLKPKLAERIHVCEDISILAEHFDVSIFPKEYGGTGNTLEELEELVKLKFAEYKDRFEIIDNLKVDESLRPEKLENDEMLGFYGNFKMLDLD